MDSNRSKRGDTPPSSLEPLVRSLLVAFPRLGVSEQRVAVVLYRALAEGEPVPLRRVAHEVGLSESGVESILEVWPGVIRDDLSRVIGFWGLALPPMSHRFSVGARILHTWCAWDALFIPEILGRPAFVESTCPVSGKEIRLVSTPDGPRSLDPAEAVLSFRTPDPDAVERNVIESFCHLVHFFRSERSASEWLSDHPGTFLLSVEEGYQLGRRTNAIRFGSVLTRRALEARELR